MRIFDLEIDNIVSQTKVDKIYKNVSIVCRNYNRIKVQT